MFAASGQSWTTPARVAWPAPLVPVATPSPSCHTQIRHRARRHAAAVRSPPPEGLPMLEGVPRAPLERRTGAAREPLSRAAHAHAPLGSAATRRSGAALARPRRGPRAFAGRSRRRSRAARNACRSDARGPRRPPRMGAAGECHFLASTSPLPTADASPPKHASRARVAWATRRHKWAGAPRQRRRRSAPVHAAVGDAAVLARRETSGRVYTPPKRARAACLLQHPDVSAKVSKFLGHCSGGGMPSSNLGEVVAPLPRGRTSSFRRGALSKSPRTGRIWGR